LIKSKQDGEMKISSCEATAADTLVDTGVIGRQTIERELEALRQDWHQYSSDLAESQNHLQLVVDRWAQYESMYECLAGWMKVEEKRMKEYSLVSTLEEKKAQVTKYQVGVVCSGALVVL
jgi:hypothetical protein